jgi:ATP-dependent exoDNAse (exonuclease V) beta subunit
MNRGPFRHEVIRASAGSGKTFQLTNRFLALLASGVEPDVMLATTFTRKAAGEILDRVLARLAYAAGDAIADKKLAKDIGQGSCDRDRFTVLLRSLLRNLHRLRISTLDSFYNTLARSFTLEIGLPPGWSIGEETDDDALREDALEQVLRQQPEDLDRLMSLLSKGEVRRSVHADLKKVIGEHYTVFRGSERHAWEFLQVPEPIPSSELAAVLESLRLFDFSVCRHKGFINARDDDVARFEAQDWPEFIAKGLAAIVASGNPVYFNRPIPDEAQALYRRLLQHAGSQILGKIAAQTRATWQLLEDFHLEFWQLKQESGSMRFDDVTQTLVEALGRAALSPQALAFRLDGAVEHLMLDEFQDTSLPQWRVLKPMAQAIIRGAAGAPCSFFCVGDVKQAIYGWRGGMAEILNGLQDSLGTLEITPLDQSWRSSQSIIDLVNQVFGSLRRVTELEKCRAGLDGWASRFQAHTTVKKDAPGYVRVETGPAQLDGEKVEGQRERHFVHVAREIAGLFKNASGLSIGILCRKNDAVARMIYELRQQKVEASEEGGKPLTDSPAVEVILSLFTLADHPSHSIARFHLENSPPQLGIGRISDPDAFAHTLRAEILAEGYGPFTLRWANKLKPACDERDLRRLQQLVDMAFDFQPRSTLRPVDFVNLVREKRVLDPTGASVRVMTIHGAKGLEFNIVVLPECDDNLTGQSPPFVVGRDPKSLEVSFVCRYANEATQRLLSDEERCAFEEDRRGQVEESLSTLYVAMTRAIHALHIFIPGRRSPDRKDAWYNLLWQILPFNATKKEWPECKVLYDYGDPNWTSRLALKPRPKIVEEPKPPNTIVFADKGAHRRGLEQVAPSHRERGGVVRLQQLFHPSEGTGMAAGRLYHAWFEMIGWIEDGIPSNADLLAAAQKKRTDLPPDIWSKMDEMMATFRQWLDIPTVRMALQRSAYTDPSHPGFPLSLRTVWQAGMGPPKVERERRFLVRDTDGGKFWNGSLDRVVWLGDAERIIAADILDFKTDELAPGNQEGLAQRVEYYRPQLQAYRRAVARLAHLQQECISARLVFPFAACVREV